MAGTSQWNQAVTPAQLLAGRVLEGGWVVGASLERKPHATGGVFSECYRVESGDGGKAFLKALDFSAAMASADPARVLEAMTAAFNFERDLLAACRERRMDRVVRALADGTLTVDGSPVQYLILELADGDVRSHLALSASIDVAWKLRCLHHIATGLRQLHSADIAHQDVKPSNVLVFGRAVSKLGDLGSAAQRDHPGPHDALTCAGDTSYAPPELVYNYVPPDWGARRFGCDVYLLGSMAVFLFTGLSTAALVNRELHDQHRWDAWRGSFGQVLPYLRDAFDRALQTFEGQIANPQLAAELTTVVRQLCEPDPALRGHPLDRGGNQFSLQRYISVFNLLAERADVGLFSA